MSRIFRIFSAVGVAGVLLGLAIGAYAFTNGVAINGGNSLDAGYGTQSVQSFSITPHFTVGSDHKTVTTVTFDLGTALNSGATLLVNFDGVAGDWAPVTGSPSAGTCQVSGTAVTCTPFTAATTLDKFVGPFQIEITQ